MRTRTSPSTVRSATFTINPPKAGLKRRPGPRPETLSGFTCTCKYSGVLEIHVDIIKFITELEITIIFEHWAVRRLSVSKSEWRSVLYYRYVHVDYRVSGPSPCVFVFLCKQHFDVLTFPNTYKFGTVRKLIAVAWNFWGLWRHLTPPPRAKYAPSKILRVPGNVKNRLKMKVFFRDFFFCKINFKKVRR